jgi:hypothetical protein
MKDPLRGVVVWAVPENKEVSVTLFKDARTQEMEDKEWTFVIEDVRTVLSYWKKGVPHSVSHGKNSESTWKDSP